MPLSVCAKSAGRAAPPRVCRRTWASSRSSRTSGVGNQNSISTFKVCSSAGCTGVSRCVGPEPVAGPGFRPPRSHGVTSHCAIQACKVGAHSVRPAARQRRSIWACRSAGCALTWPKPSWPAHSSNSCRKLPGDAPRGKLCSRPAQAGTCSADGGVCAAAPVSEASSRKFAACAVSTCTPLPRRDSRAE